MGIVGKIITCFFGAILGCMIAVLFLVKIITRKIRRTAKSETEITENERIIVEKYKKDYKKKSKKRFWKKLFAKGDKKKKSSNREGGKTVSESTMPEYLSLINDLARLNNPQSENPLLEFSERKFFEACHRVIDRIYLVLDSVNSPILKTIKISFVYSSINVYKIVTENKTVKFARKTSEKVMMVAKFFNPFYWVKRVVNKVVLSAIISEIMLVSIEMVAEEFSTLYRV